MPARGCGAGMSLSCVCDLPWLQGSWLVRNDRLVHPLPCIARHLHRHRPVPLTNPPICSGSVPHTYGVFEPCGCLHACPCQSVRFCHCMFAWTSGGNLKSRPPWLPVEDAGAELWCHLSFLLGSLRSVFYICTLNVFLCSNLQKICWLLIETTNPAESGWESCTPAVRRLVRMCLNWLRGSLFISCVPLSLWINRISRAFHQLSSDFYLFIFLTTQTAQWALPPPGLKTFI